MEDESEEAQETGTQRDGADVSKVTDYVEQEEMDHAKASRAIAALTDSMDTVDQEAEAKREKELAAVKINQVRGAGASPCPPPEIAATAATAPLAAWAALRTHSFGPNPLSGGRRLDCAGDGAG